MPVGKQEKKDVFLRCKSTKAFHHHGRDSKTGADGVVNRGGRTKSWGGDGFFFDHDGAVCQVSERIALIAEEKFHGTFERISYDDALTQWTKESKKGKAGAVPVKPEGSDDESDDGQDPND